MECPWLWLLWLSDLSEHGMVGGQPSHHRATVPRYICVDPQGVVTHLEPEEAESKATGQVRRLEAGS